MRKLALFALAGMAWAQPAAHWPPRFEDYPVTESWSGPPAPLKLATSSERMFRTQLTNAAKQPPDFAGHYRFAGWGCGSGCAAGAVIDLKSGVIHPPPMGGSGAGWDRWIFCGGIHDGRMVDFRRDSALLALRCGGNAQKPDEHYFVWENHSFRRLTPSSK